VTPPMPEPSASAGGSDAASPAGRGLALVCAAQFVLQLDFSIVNVTLPTIQHDLGHGRRTAPVDRHRVCAHARLAAAGRRQASGLVWAPPDASWQACWCSRWHRWRLLGWGAAARQVLLAGLICLAGGQLWLAQVSATATYPTVVLPGLLLTSMGIGLALPTASIAITSGVRSQDQGVAAALFTTSQQAGAAVGLAALATAAAARTADASRSLAAGYRLSFRIAAAFIVLAPVIVAFRCVRASRRAVPGALVP
jgi:MFS family permease